MTQEGKCDICRLRKVKCDEAHPECGPCRKGSRPCQYTYGKRFCIVNGARRYHCAWKVTPDAVDGRPVASVRVQGPDSPAAEKRAGSGTEETLSLRSTRPAKDGNGVFQTFVPVLTAKQSVGIAGCASKKQQKLFMSAPSSYDTPLTLWLLPSGPAARLLGRWMFTVRLFPEGYDTPSALGNWMGLVPQRIAHSDSIAAAAECLVNSTTAYVHDTPENRARTDASNVEALRSIREAILATESRRRLDDVLLAIGLLHIVETLVRASQGDYRYHQTGILSLLLRATARGTKWTHVTWRMFLSTTPWDTFSAVFQSRDSIFDEPQWLSLPPFEYPSCNTDAISQVETTRIYQNNNTIWIKLPRLVRLVRQAREAPEDSAARVEATQLAAELYSLDLDDWVQQCLDRGLISVVPTQTPESRPLLENSFAFASHEVFNACEAYWSIRILVYGLILTLANLSPPMPEMLAFDAALVAAQDVRAAECIAMCYDYATWSPGRIPFNSMRHVMPAQSAFCSWHRMERRALAAGAAADVERARGVKQLCVWMMDDIAKNWGGSTGLTTEFWEQREEVFAGGPLRSIRITGFQASTKA